MSYRKITKALLNNGWEYKRTSFSHHIFVKNGHSVPIPFHGKEINRGIVYALERETGLQLLP